MKNRKQQDNDQVTKKDNLIFATRMRLCVTQEALAKRLGITKNYVYLMESGRKPITDMMAKKLDRLDISEFERTEEAAATAAALRQGLNGLHGGRGELVRMHKALRLAGRKEELEALWERIGEITAQIEQAEADLARVEGRATDTTPLLRDAAAELPDDETTVVVVTDDAEMPVRLGYHADGFFSDGEDMPIFGSVLGWCHLNEAAAVLRSAKREVRHG